jgi:hypothetical protein
MPPLRRRRTAETNVLELASAGNDGTAALIATRIMPPKDQETVMHFFRWIQLSLRR